MPIYWTAKGLSDFQTPLRPPMDIQKSLKLHICILWSQVVTLKATTGLSLISFIYGTPPKSAPARKCWQNPDLLGDLWPRRKEFTKLKLCQILNLSLIHPWTKFGFGVSSPSQWKCILNIEHFKPKVAKFGSFDGKFAQIWKFLNGQKKICSVKFVLQMFQGILIEIKHGFGRKIFLSSNTLPSKLPNLETFS